AGVPLRVHGGTAVDELAAELERRLLAVQELGDQVRELVPGGLAARRLVGANLGEHARQQRGADLRHEPLVPGQRGGPVEILLRVPLAALAALVESAQLLDLAAVLPGPVQLERHVDVELLAQPLDLGLVDELDHLEVADRAAIVLENHLHQRVPPDPGVWGATTRPRCSSARTSALRRRTSLAENSGRPSISLPKSPEAK